MTDSESIRISTGNLKEQTKKYLNNKYTTSFFMLLILTGIFLIFKSYNFLTSVGFLSNLYAAFSIKIIILLMVALLISTILAHFRKFRLMFIPILIWLIITTVVIRTSNVPQLKDVSTGDYTLGPDLDPFLYWRHAIEISEGRLGPIDYFRQAPLGVNSYAYSNIMPWTIFIFYKIINIFGDYSVTYAAIILPVVLFIVSLIGFFLFVKTISSLRMTETRSWITALIASIFYSFIPSMLPRTVAGIPEIESLGMAFFWFALLFFIMAWTSEDRKRQIFWGILAGLFTGLMSWSWGGYRYLYMILSLTTLTFFIFTKRNPKLIVVFSSWIIPSLIADALKFRSLGFLFSSFGDISIGVFVLILLWFDFVAKKVNLDQKIGLNKINLPSKIKFLILFILVIFLGTLLVKPAFMFNLFSTVIERLLYPFGRARVSLTVAENRAPYLSEVLISFGGLVWLFLLGSLIIFYEAIKHFNSKNKFLLTSGFILLLLGLVFTRFSQNSLFNGENLISQSAYLGSILIFLGIFMYIYLNSYRNRDNKTLEDFDSIGLDYILVLVIAFLAMISMRGAVRLFFIISPMLIILASFVPVRMGNYLKSDDDLKKMFVWIVLIISLIFLMTTFAKYSVETTVSAANIIPSSYNQQWQKGMSWVRESTPEGSIFVHWWDYGYWVQTLGQRPTVTDGAHANAWWDHTTARYLLTTPKPETALSLMKTHNVSYLLIDSSDLGKYPAYSSIGSDLKNQDRFSQIPVMGVDESQTIERDGREARLYQGVSFVDEDLVYSEGGNQIFLPEKEALVVGMIIDVSKTGEVMSFNQPSAIFYYRGQQIKIPIRYLYYKGKIIDFKTGLNGTARILQSLTVQQQGLNMDNLGAAIYLSPLVSKSLFAELYLMDDPNKNYQTITLAHSEQDPIVIDLRSKGVNLDDIIYFQGFRGPIKIWKVSYPNNILTREEFLRTSGEYAGLDNLTFSM